MFRLSFTMQVLGAEAAEKLLNKEVTQTLRSPNDDIVAALLHGQSKIGDEIEVALDGVLIGLAHLSDIDRVSWVALTPTDAVKGGFSSLDDLQQALQRGGYRFQPMEKYLFYRIQFAWEI